MERMRSQANVFSSKRMLKHETTGKHAGKACSKSLLARDASVEARWRGMNGQPLETLTLSSAVVPGQRPQSIWACRRSIGSAELL
jgi:hypothetical protein